jgi:hypothetical protein
MCIYAHVPVPYLPVVARPDAVHVCVTPIMLQKKGIKDKRNLRFHIIFRNARPTIML